MRQPGITLAYAAVLYTQGMRILVVATKPPWPACDGGRLVLWHSLCGLAQAGHEIRLIAPVEADGTADHGDNGGLRAATAGAGVEAGTGSGAGVAAAVGVDASADTSPKTTSLAMLRTVCDPQLIPVPARSWPAATAAALRSGRALSVARHHHAALEQAVADTVQDWRPDLVHAEQLQALANAAPARRAGVPTVLRMQNVESSLWRQVSAARLIAWPLRLEAQRLRRDEARALQSATRTLTLTARDAAALAPLAAPQRVRAVAPAFPGELPPGTALETGPVVCVAGSGGWWPNRQALDWLLAGVAPRLAAAGLPLHVFGSSPRPLPGVRWHAPPADAAAAFPAGAIAAIPLLIGSGLRMRLLEAWARGLPAVASSVAAAGLDVAHGRELLIADTPADFAAALLQLATQPQLAASLVRGGRAYLRQHHDPLLCAQALLREYELALAD